MERMAGKLWLTVLVLGVSFNTSAANYTYKEIPVQQGASLDPKAISASGAVGGSMGIPGVGSVPFLYQNGVVTTSDGDDGYSVNSRGVVAGRNDPANNWNSSEGILVEDGIMTTLPGTFIARDVNEAGVAVGESKTRKAFVFKNGLMEEIDIPGVTGGFAIDINNAGDIAGTGRNANGSGRVAFVRDADGTLHVFPSPTGGVSQGAGINDAGQALLIMEVAPNTSHFFIWDDGVATDTGVTWNTGLVADTLQIQFNNLGQFVTGVGLYGDGVFTQAADLVPPELVGMGADGILRMGHKVVGINDAGQITGSFAELDLTTIQWSNVAFILTPSSVCN